MALKKTIRQSQTLKTTEAKSVIETGYRFTYFNIIFYGVYRQITQFAHEIKLGNKFGVYCQITHFFLGFLAHLRIALFHLLIYVGVDVPRFTLESNMVSRNPKYYMVLMIKIGTAEQTGMTDMHKSVIPVWLTLSKCRFGFTIVQLSSRRSKCIYIYIYITSDLEFG